MHLCHYLEIQAKIPWLNFSPWDHLGVESIGVSVDGEQDLYEVPGCSGGFLNFEKHLLNNKIIQQTNYKNLQVYLIPIETIYQHGLNYFQIILINCFAKKVNAKHVIHEERFT
jgi:hypothetical protein